MAFEGTSMASNLIRRARTAVSETKTIFINLKLKCARFGFQLIIADNPIFVPEIKKFLDWPPLCVVGSG